MSAKLEPVLEALAGMVALWEATFDAEHRCRCVAREGQRGEIMSMLDRPCAYCSAQAVLEQGRLMLDATPIGRT